MSHVVSEATRPFLSAHEIYRIHQVPAAHDNLIWLLEDVESSDVAAIDGPGSSEVLNYCKENDLKLVAVFNTHTHFDHIGINNSLQSKGILEGLRVVGCRLCADDIPGINETVDEGDVVSFGQGVGQVWRTEGHLNGHISFIFDGVLFCGDTLFGAGCGYLFDGPPKKMHESLQRFATLDSNVRVCCAHEYTEDNVMFASSVEPSNGVLKTRAKLVHAKRRRGQSTLPSTIALEVATNPFIRVASTEIQQTLKIKGYDVDGLAGYQIFETLRALKDSKEYTQELSSYETWLRS